MYLLILFACQASRGQDDAVASIASSCSGCHNDAASSLPQLERLTPQELESALLSYRRGERAATLMNRIARGLTPDEIRRVAAELSTP